MLSALSKVQDNIITEDNFMNYVTVSIDKCQIELQKKRAQLWTAFEEYNGGLPLQLEKDKFTVFKLDNVYGLTCNGVYAEFVDAATLLGDKSIGVIFNGDKCYDECIEGEWKYTKL